LAIFRLRGFCFFAQHQAGFKPLFQKRVAGTAYSVTMSAANCTTHFVHGSHAVRGAFATVTLPCWPNRLDFIDQASDFAANADEWRSNALEIIGVEWLGGPAQWKGSAFELRESDRAMELWGGAYTASYRSAENSAFATALCDLQRSPGRQV
jgi:hypothetical protein